MNVNKNNKAEKKYGNRIQTGQLQLKGRQTPLAPHDTTWKT